MLSGKGPRHRRGLPVRDRAIRFAALCFGVFSLGVSAHAEERQLVLTAVDKTTGKPVAARRTVTRGERVVRATSGSQLTCSVGDRLYVYNRNYDLVVVLVNAKTPARVRVELKRARTATVVVKDVNQQDLRGLRVEVRHFHSGWDKGAPVFDVRRVGIPTGRLEVSVPAGVDNMIEVIGDSVIAWPPGTFLRAGVTTVMHVDRGRFVPVAWPAGLPAEERQYVLCIPDRTAATPGPPRRIDAWRWYTNGDRWRIETVTKTGLRVLPDSAFHLFWVADDGPRYRYASRKTARIDLSGAAVTQQLKWPQVDGRPVPEGTWIGVGRLDMTALNLMKSYNPSGVFVEANRRKWKRRPPRLAVSATLTCWHPKFGLAHAPWRKGEVPNGRSHPSRIRLKFPGGVEVEGKLATFAMWRGTGTLFISAPCENMAIRFQKRAAAVYPGVRSDAWYGVLVKVVLTDPRTGKVRRIDRNVSIKTPRNGGEAVIRIE